MFLDIIRLTVTRVLHDKILLGLLIVGILGIFVGGFATKDETPASIKKMQAEAGLKPGNESGSATGTPEQAAAPLEPGLATDFTKWWMSGAMDYAAASAQENHVKACRWMTEQASAAFQACYWTPEMARDVSQGHLIAAFQPVAVQAQAINPDGTVVVGISGTFVTQKNGGRPTTQQIQLDVLVRRESEGLRIAGIYNQVAALPSTSVY